MRWPARLTLCLAAISTASCTVVLDERVFWVPRNVDLAERDEADTGLFMGRALKEALSLDLTYRGYWTTKIEFRQRPEKFIPAEAVRSRLPYASGELSVLRVRARGTAAKADAPVFVHCYGIGANLYNNGVQYSLKLLPYGEVIQFDLPGHGESTGAPSVADFDAAVDALAEQLPEMTAGRQVIFWGHSLGGWICADLATRVPGADALIIEASARDAASVGRFWLPAVMRPFIRLKAADALARYDLADTVVTAQLPTLILGAGRDDIIAEPLVRTLAEAVNAAGLPARYRAFPQADHSTIAFADGFDETVTAFLATLPKVPPQAAPATAPGSDD